MEEMTEVEALTELERIERENGPMNQAEQRHLESLLALRAHVIGWTGDPLSQPASAVLAAYRQMRAENAAAADPDRSQPAATEPPRPRS
jgi:hypothetical protein